MLGSLLNFGRGDITPICQPTHPHKLNSYFIKVSWSPLMQEIQQIAKRKKVQNKEQQN